MEVKDDDIVRQVVKQIAKIMAACEAAIVRKLESEFGGKLGELQQNIDKNRTIRQTRVTR